MVSGFAECTEHGKLMTWLSKSAQFIHASSPAKGTNRAFGTPHPPNVLVRCSNSPSTRGLLRENPLLTPDFRDTLSALSAEDVEFLLVGAYAMAAPRRIDMLTSIDGVEFDKARHQRQIIEVEGQTFSVISRAQLLQNKKASGRPKDLADMAWLESEAR